MKMFRNMSLLFVAATIALSVSAQSATGTQPAKTQATPANTTTAPAKTTKAAPAKTAAKPALAKKTGAAVKPANNQAPQK